VRAPRVAKLTSRDYKKTARRRLDLRRYREFGYGLLVGLVLAGAAFAWFGNPHHGRETSDVPRPQPGRIAPADPDATGDGEASKKYDFYEMLPHFEVVVPEKDKDVKRDIPTAKIERPGEYVLQAGSYRNEADAARVARQLTLQGVPAKVERVAVDADVWHRVRIGPISNLDELNRVRKQLAAADVDALLIRVGD
jgi:cell division protein FtsN